MAKLDKIKTELGKGVPGHINKMYLDAAEIKQDAIVLPNEIMARKFREHYGPNLGGMKVSYEERDNGERALPFESVSYSDVEKKNNKGILKICKPHSYVNSFLSEDPKLILHGGNSEAFNHLEDLVASFADGLNEGGCSVLRGKRGLGKSSLVDRFAYRLRENDVPVVGFSLDALSTYLSPAGGNYDPKLNGIPEPDYYRIAKNLAKVVILDQAHGLFGGNGKGRWNRSGTQGRVLNLIEEVQRRDGHVVFCFTETDKYGFSDMAGELESGSKGDAYDRIGNGDLGSRLANFVDYEVSNIPKIERGDYVREMIRRSSIVKNSGLDSGLVLEGFMDAAYGAALTPRKIAGNIAKVEASAWAGNVGGAEDIVRRIGGKSAVGRLRKENVRRASSATLSENDLRSLLLDNPYDVEDVRGALYAYEDGEIATGEKTLDGEIGSFYKELCLLGKDKKFGKSGWVVSDTSKEALAKLMFQWNNKKRLF